LGFGKTEIFLQKGLDNGQSERDLICPSGSHVAGLMLSMASARTDKTVLFVRLARCPRCRQRPTWVSRPHIAMRQEQLMRYRNLAALSDHLAGDGTHPSRNGEVERLQTAFLLRLRLLV
jgi:hypothetical protein